MTVPLIPAVTAALFIAAGLPAFAQTAATPAPQSAAASAAKPAQKAASKPRLKRSAQKAVEEVTPIDDDPSITLTDADLAVAKQVYVGELPCELGASVHVRPARRTGLFVVSTKGHRFLMHPVESRTGAIRLEDAKRGAMWLQLGNKSMLMSQKLGRRLADECQSPQQVTFAEELKRNPRPSILDAPAPAAAAAAAQPPGTPASAPAPAESATITLPAGSPPPATSEPAPRTN
jgi:hypothetical protein